MGHIHYNEGYSSKHKVEVKGIALKQKIEAYAYLSFHIHDDYLILMRIYSN